MDDPATSDATVVRSAGELARRTAGFVGLGLAAVAVLVIAVQALTAPPPPDPEVAVPSVVGSALAEARTALATVDLRTGRVLERASATAEPGTVLAQDPAPGATLPVGGRVDLTVATAPNLVTVPTVAGAGGDDAFARLRAAGLVPVPGGREASETLPEGTVVRTDPGPGSRVDRGTTVRVVTSTGPAEVRVRDVTARALADARARLEAQGLVVDVVEEVNAVVAPGFVIRQAPLAGEPVVAGATVTLWVAAGEAPPAG